MIILLWLFFRRFLHCCWNFQRCNGWKDVNLFSLQSSAISIGCCTDPRARDCSFVLGSGEPLRKEKRWKSRFNFSKGKISCISSKSSIQDKQPCDCLFWILDKEQRIHEPPSEKDGSWTPQGTSPKVPLSGFPPNAGFPAFPLSLIQDQGNVTSRKPFTEMNGQEVSTDKEKCQ